MRITLGVRLRCWLFGHDPEIVSPDPRPPEYMPSGRRKLRKALAVCSRCGEAPRPQAVVARRPWSRRLIVPLMAVAALAATPTASAPDLPHGCQHGESSIAAAWVNGRWEVILPPVRTGC